MTGILISVLIGFIVGAVVLAVAGYNPLEAYGAMFAGMFRKPKYVSQIVINAVPIILTGLSVSFAYKSGLFNIGAEGQYMIGTVTAALVGRYFLLPMGVHPAVVLLLAFLFGGLFGGWPGGSRPGSACMRSSPPSCSTGSPSTSTTSSSRCPV